MDRINRRKFLKIGAIGAAATILAGCQNPRRWVILEPYVKPPEEQLAGVATFFASTCRQCPAGCGIIVRVMNGRALKLEGNPDHPLNKGKLCARGQAGLQLLYNPDRLTGPFQQAQRSSKQLTSLTWDAAINTLGAKIKDAGSQVAVILGSTTSGHLYDIFQKLTTAIGAPAPLVYDQYAGFIGYPLLQANSQALFDGADLPAYNIGEADVVLSFGADFLGTWTSAVRYGVEYGQFRSGKLGQRGLLVQMEPRMTITGAKADQWLPIKPGSEGEIAQAIAYLISTLPGVPAERAAQAKGLFGSVDINQAAADSGLTVDMLTRLAIAFGNASHPVAIPGSSLGGQANAQDQVEAVQLLNFIATPTGENGGVLVSTGSPSKAVLKPQISTYSEVVKLIGQMQAGQVKVLLVYGANPVYDLPVTAGFSAGLAKVPTVVSFSPMLDETAASSDLILPDHTYLEGWGYELVSPSFGVPVVSSQQPVVTPVPGYDTRGTGDVLLAVAKSIPAVASALPESDEVAYLKQIITQLPAGQYGGTTPDELWARFLQHGGWWQGFSQTLTLSPGAKLSSSKLTSPQFLGNESDYPYFLTIYLSTLLSDGRGANLPWLQGVPDPLTTESWQTWVEINPDTAQKLGVRNGDIVQVISQFGEISAPVYAFEGIRPDTIAIPTGQGHIEYGRYASQHGGNPIVLVGPQADAASGGLAWANIRVKVVKTGSQTQLATFENVMGVQQGFINQGFPGQ
jgi:anaerobic selenocysteine-containing dehydrogenase